MYTEASSNVIEQRLTNLFPSEALEDHAEAVGVIERDRKLQIPPLVWSFAFGFATGESRTLAAFRRSYNATADETLSPGGYYQRLTPNLATAMRTADERGCNWDTVGEYLERLDNGAATKRIVYLADQLGIDLPARKERVASFTSGYSLLDPTRPDIGSTDSAYRLRINVEPPTLEPTES